MSPQVTLVRAGTMFRGELTGDIDPEGGGAPGLFISDARALSRLQLTVNGNACAVASRDGGADRQSCVLAPILARNETSDVVVSRTQTIDASGLLDALEVHNVTTRPTIANVALALESDFADPFMLRSDRRTFDRSDGSYGALLNAPAGEPGVTLHYARRRGDKHFAAAISVETAGGATIELRELDGTPPRAMIRWRIELPAGVTASISVRVRASLPATVESLEPAEVPGLTPDLTELRRQAIEDLTVLRMPFRAGEEAHPDASDLTILAAGAPWFLTLFGRDSMLASMLAEPDLPGIADDNLLALVATQADAVDPTRVAEPGKIVHEIRVSELASLGEVPFGRYYGSVDATPLFLSALATTGSLRVQRASEAAARAAVSWMRGPGGLDRTGFLRYVSDPAGLVTQGWKDSADSVAHADGTIATGAIALCEVQGYAWRALTDTARLAREVWNDKRWATELDDVASQLRERFRARFWMPGRDFPALAIDGADTRVEVVGSNAGHLLFSGMLSQEEAALVATRLMDADMFTGWGIRTLSSTEARYNPLSYHNGSVWPHDTMLTAVGMAAYGMHGEARILASAMVDAAAHFGNRPAELFGGFDRAQFAQPLKYAHAAVPQAWSSAAMLAATRILADPSTTQKAVAPE
jgi:glycogen debranching enzyme